MKKEQKIGEPPVTLKVYCTECFDYEKYSIVELKKINLEKFVCTSCLDQKLKNKRYKIIGINNS